MSKVAVIGGGAAGMMAAIMAARNGHTVTLYEKNEKLGKKIFITGKGRCNITNACDMEELLEHVVTNRKFLYSAFYAFTNWDTIDFFESLGLKTKIERGNRVFPASDKSSDVIRVLELELQRLGITVRLQSKVAELVVEDGTLMGIRCNDKSLIPVKKVIVATGGLSYTRTGSTGDGYKFGKEIGHTVTQLTPSLVPFQVKGTYHKDMQGLSLRNIQITVKSGNKEIYQDFGELLFTHFGVSGPVILSASSYAVPYLKKGGLTLLIDLKPALSEEQLDERILRDFKEYSNKQFKNALDQLLPKKMIPVILSYVQIDPDKKVHEVTKEERLRIVSALKCFTLQIEGIRGYEEAVITRGGITIKEVNPSTMESKCVPGVYFSGEVLDLDALTGGFNLQIAWSTGYLAGMNI